MSGIGPGVGFAEAGAMVCCAGEFVAPAIRPTASNPAMHALRASLGVLTMTSPPIPDGVASGPCAASSSRRDAEAAEDRRRDRKLALDDLERQRGERPRRRPVDDGGGVAGVIARVVAG